MDHNLYPHTPALAVAGPSRSGKTTLICRLAGWFSGRGLKVAAVKHSHKPLSDLIRDDVFRLHEAGALAVGRSVPGWLEVTRFPLGEPDLEEVLRVLAPGTDLILVEGYKWGPLPKIALADPNAPQEIPPYPAIIALVSPQPLPGPWPVFAPNGLGGLGSFILKHMGMGEL